MTSERDLMPCPFCGSTPSVGLCGFGTAEVECLTDECGTRGPRKPSVKAAIAAWNRRAQQVPLTDEQIYRIWSNSTPSNFEARSFARAIERAHGISAAKECSDAA